MLAVMGFLGIVCAFAGLLGIRSALDAGQPLWEPLGMIWGGGAVGMGVWGATERKSYVGPVSSSSVAVPGSRSG
ncbi:hypothetical protein, partial [Roseomonas mucosa]|uniref:hypothetical protein n=1 Tax=Roseomonas mucosa TaxID=207340 RepID=UPI0028CD28DD